MTNLTEDRKVARVLSSKRHVPPFSSYSIRERHIHFNPPIMGDNDQLYEYGTASTIPGETLIFPSNERGDNIGGGAFLFDESLETILRYKGYTLIDNRGAYNDR